MSLMSKREQSSIKQQWAQERNMTGGLLKGIWINLKRVKRLDSTTLEEEMSVTAAISHLGEVLKYWKPNQIGSKELYLSRRKTI